MKRFLFVSLGILFAFAASAQLRLPPADSRINPELLQIRFDGGSYNESRWTASWISTPDADSEYGVYMFRKSFELSQEPSEFLVNVSADNRYKLYVNGAFVCLGPAKGDAHNWNFDTVDLAPYLVEGTNVVAAVVWNFASSRPVAVMSFGLTGFLLQGNSAAERIIDSDRSWKGIRCRAYSPGTTAVRGYYAAGCTDRLDASLYPWGWETMDYDDSAWPSCVAFKKAALKGSGDYSHWQLVPRPIPLMEHRVTELPNDIYDRTFPPNTREEIILDNLELTTGYPSLWYSGGKGSRIDISYAESLYEQESGWVKGNRNETEGKIFSGYTDTVLPDGGADRTFEPLWWRTWRYLKVTVTTADEPLTIDNIIASHSMYPFERVSTFNAPEDPDLGRMLDIGWRTARLCAHETYMDCPYFEQLQYFGDARIQANVTMYNTTDTCMVRNLLEQGRQSMSSDGLVASRYPSHLHQFIPPYALFWINTCHDWWMYRGDEKYLKTLLPVMRSSLSWFSEYLGEDGSLRNVPFWNFADWADMHSGMFPFDSNGSSAYMDLIYVLALRDAAEMEDAMGSESLAGEYRKTADKVAQACQKTYWDAARGFYADNGDHSDFSQHINSLAVLAGLVEGEDAYKLMNRVLDDPSLRPCTIYFRYYLQMAMAHSGAGDRLLGSLGVLRDQLNLGLTTWAEMPEPSRSDCHAWGASPNIEFFRMILGIDSDAPGFKKVRIAPCLCGLTDVSGSIPHPLGSISVSYKILGSGRLRASIILPDGVSGVFVWNGKVRPLRPGLNRL